MSRTVPPAPARRSALLRCLAAAATLAAVLPALLAVTSSPASAAGSISLSKATGISLDGETLTVSGSGFDSTRGIYVMFCRDVGGRPTGGNCNGSQQWVTSSPMGSATWSGPGTFTTTIDATSAWGDVDCTQVVCGVVTRNDHLDAVAKDQDTFTPVSFAVPQETTTTSTSTPVDPGGTTTTTAVTDPTPGPDTSNATRLTLSRSTDLADGEVITVSGSGFVADQGVYVQFCVAPTGTLGTPAGRTTACYPDQDGEHTVWLTPVPAGGSWTTPLTVSASFADVDCRAQACGVFVRRDHSGGATDFSQDAFAPVTFGDPATTPTTAPGPVGARLQVTPTSGIRSGSTITVEGAGFRAGRDVFVGVCDLAVANFAACDFANVEQVTVAHGTERAGGPGTFTASLVARARFGTTDCHAATSRCAVATWAVSGNDAALEVHQAITFASEGGTPATTVGTGRVPGATSGVPLARTGTDPAHLTLAGTLALLVGAGLFVAGRRRIA